MHNMLTKLLKKLFGPAAILIILAACSSVNQSQDDQLAGESKITISLAGSGTVTSIFLAVEDQFESETPGYDLIVHSGSGTGGGIEGVLERIIDVTGMARPPRESEPIEFLEFGMAGNAIIAHRDVGVTSLTSSQIALVFSGEITNWVELGGVDIPIIVYIRSENDSSIKLLRSAILGDTPFAQTNTNLITSQPNMVAAVETTPGSIGVAKWPVVLALGADIIAISVDGIFPNSPDYSMIGPLGVGYLSDHLAEIQPLIDWIFSANGQAALAQLGVITLE